MKTIIRTIIAAAIFYSIVSAQGVGKIYGTITDADNGLPIPAASVFAIGEKFGAASSPEGEYFIVNVPEGNYTLKAVYHDNFVIKENVKVESGKSTKVNFELPVIFNTQIDDKFEQFSLKQLPENTREELASLKQAEPDKYAIALKEAILKLQRSITDKLQELKIKLHAVKVGLKKLKDDYTILQVGEERKEVEQKIKEAIAEEYDLREQILEYQLQGMIQDIQKLEKELQKYKAEKQRIIKSKFESIVN